MKLSDIVHCRNQLDTVNVNLVSAQAQSDLAAITHMVVNQSLDLGDFKNLLTSSMLVINDSVQHFAKVLDNLKTELDLRIAQQQAEYYQESTRLYQHEIRFDNSNYVLSRKLAIDDASDLVLRTRLRNYTDWRIPGMIIRPGHESFIEELVPLDPLYIVDHAQDLIDPAVLRFNETYRARLRQYVISENTAHILGDLPCNQFGLIFAYNYFNFKPMELIQQYLVELYEKLRSGGTLVMTYNDCDQAHGVALSERNFMCYTPGSHIVKIAESTGFDVTYRHTGSGDLAWMELQRPGKIVSVRGGQTLARPVAQSK